MKSKWLSRLIVGSMICGLASLALVGCVSETIRYVDKTTGQVVQLDSEIVDIQTYLPPRARDIEKLGNRWFTFELQTGEVNRKFLIRKYYGSHRETGVVITELNLTKPCTCGTMCEAKETKRGEGPGLVE